MSIMLMLIIMMSLIFMMMTHPLSLGLILLIQTLIISLITGTLNINFWYSYILFLIMIGGMLILFMYMTSIASNEKFKINMKIIWTLIPIPIIFSQLPMWVKDFMMKNNESMSMMSTNLMYQSMNKFVNFPMNFTLTFMMIYLLLTLIVIVKISQFKQGPLRQMFN